MRKIVLCLAVSFMTVPAMAASNVNITCTTDYNEITVSYESDANLIRAFGLDITIITPADAKITKVEVVDANYRIYPGQIVIVDGNVTDYDTCYDPCDLGDANVTVEMGSLYTWDTNYMGDANVGYGMEPEANGVLLKFYVNRNCHYAITENAARRGIVMEDPDEEPNVTLCSGVLYICGDCPDFSSWQPAVPDGWMGPEDVAWLINIIKVYPSYYCNTADPYCDTCLDFSSWDPGVPDGWLGPEDVAWEINMIKAYPGYYRQCPP